MTAPCLKCGAATENLQEFAGQIAAEIFMCPSCFDTDMADFDEDRRRFEELIAAGVPRDRANAIMIDRIEGAKLS